QAEIARAQRKPTDSLNAYDYYLRGLAKIRRWTKDANSEALQLFCKAIELDPRLASAHGMAAWCYVLRKSRGWMTEPAQESAEATRLAGRAVHLGGDDSVALCMGGYAQRYRSEEHTSELESRGHLVCRLLLEKKKHYLIYNIHI